MLVPGHPLSCASLGLAGRGNRNPQSHELIPVSELRRPHVGTPARGRRQNCPRQHRRPSAMAKPHYDPLISIAPPLQPRGAPRLSPAPCQAFFPPGHKMALCDNVPVGSARAQPPWILCPRQPDTHSPLRPFSPPACADGPRAVTAPSEGEAPKYEPRRDDGGRGRLAPSRDPELGFQGHRRRVLRPEWLFPAAATGTMVVAAELCEVAATDSPGGLVEEPQRRRGAPSLFLGPFEGLSPTRLFPAKLRARAEPLPVLSCSLTSHGARTPHLAS